MNTLQFLFLNQWINIVREYIRNQEEHHKKKTFQQEYDEFIEKYGFQKLSDGATEFKDSVMG